MSQDIDEAMKRLKAEPVKTRILLSCRTIENPWEKFVFEIENPVSQRLSTLLYQRFKEPSGAVKVRDKRDNAHLLYFSAAIVELFEYLVNCESSYFYRPESYELFRSLPRSETDE